MAQKITFPVVHLNGTSKEELVKQMDDAYDAINNAFETLKKAAPNGRDYYVRDNEGHLDRAVAEHQDRLRRLASVMNECEAIAMAIEDEETQRTEFEVEANRE